MLSTTFSSEPSFSREKKKQKELQTHYEPGGNPPSVPGHENTAQTGGVGRCRPYLTLVKKDLARFWPLWAAYTLLWFLLIPLDIFNQGRSYARVYGTFGLSGWAGYQAMQAVCEFSGPIVSFIYGVLCAMAVWSFLYSPRAVNMTHALPVRREGQFAAHFLSGLSFSVLPHAIILVLTLIAGLATGSRGDLLNAAGAMGILSLLCLFFFSLATLCAFTTGHLVALPVFYCIINFLAYGLAGLLDWAASQFLFGFTTALSRSTAVGWLTPMQLLSGQLRWRFDFVWDGTGGGTATSLFGVPQPSDGGVAVTTRLQGLHIVLVYAAAALVLAGLALLLYRRRQLETAGDVVAVPWLRPVFQYGVALCAALAGTYVLADLLGRRDRLVLAVMLVLWGVLGFFAARMLLQKSLKVFKTGWKGAAAVAASMVLLCLGMEADVFGLERVIPDADRVVSVYVSGPDSMPSDGARYPHFTTEDPVLIRQLLAVHQTVIDHRQELKSALDAYRREASRPADISYRSFGVDYELDDGSFLDRDYDFLVISPEELDYPESVASALNALLADPDFVRLSYGLDSVEENRLTEVTIDGVGNTEKGQVTYYSPLSDHAALVQETADEFAYESGDLPSPVPTVLPSEGPAAAREWDSDLGLCPAASEELAALWRAVEADFDAGNLGRRWLFAGSDAYGENTCSTDLRFYWNQRMEDGNGQLYYSQQSVSITLTPYARNTLAALEELGLFEDGAYIADYLGKRVYPK